MRLGILTISDSVPVGKREDLSGPKIKEILGPFCSEVLYKVCTDDIEEIVTNVEELKAKVDLLVTNGGTGLMPRDNTVEALASLSHQRIEPLERAISAAMVLACGPLAALATPVVLRYNNKYIVALPGKTEEVAAAVETVIKPYFLHHIFFEHVDIKEIAREYKE